MKQRKEHIFDNEVEKKHCSQCEFYKPLERFSPHKNYWDGYHSVCKDCKRKNMHQRRKDNPPPKLSEEEWKKSYEKRSKKMGESIKKRFAEDPSYKEKLSKSRSKAIIRINSIPGEEQEYVDVEEADELLLNASRKFGW